MSEVFASGARRSIVCRVAIAVCCLAMVGACGDADDEVSGTTTTTAAEKDYAAATPSAAAPPTAALSDSTGVGADPQSDNAIIGGQPIDIGAVPWTAALVRAGAQPTSRAQFCGGVLVLPDVVMTAAHCVTNPVAPGPIDQTEIVAPDQIEVVLGRTNLDESGGERIGVTSIWVSVRADAIFAQGNLAAMNGDYALLELAQPSTQNPVALPGYDIQDSLAGMTLYDVGWGCTRVNTPPNETCEPGGEVPLQLAALEVVSQDACVAGWGEVFDVVTELCVADAQGTQAFCNGDSGGPLIAQGPDSRWYVIGLNSWSIKGCAPGIPAVVAFVPLLMDPTGQSWIDPNELFEVNPPGRV